MDDAPLESTGETSDRTNPLSPPIAGTWKLIFSDEFTEAQMKKVWTPHQYWSRGATKGLGAEQSDPANVAVAHGSLVLTAKRDNSFGTGYTGALVQAGGIHGDPAVPTFSFLHGYAEARIKLPAGRGLWPAFWLMPASYKDRYGEIDAMDNGTGNPLAMHCGAGRFGKACQAGADTRKPGAVFQADPAGSPQADSTGSPQAGWHTVGVDWEADHITWYVDGKAWAKTRNRDLIPEEAMYPIFDLAVNDGKTWGPGPDASTHLPARMEVDWVKVWQHEASKTSAPSQTLQTQPAR